MRADSKAKQYNNTKLILSLSDTFLGWLFLLIIVLIGFTQTLESWVVEVTNSPYLAVGIFTAIIGFIEIILFFPLTFYSGYILEHKYELSNQSLKRYFWENFKGLMVSIGIGIPVIITFYFFLRKYDNNWWIPMGIFIFFFTVVMGRLAPTFIFPIFYKFKPIDNESLSSLIRERCKSVGMKVEGIFQFNMSKNTKKANAAFTGIGKSKRVILGDTLLEKFNQEEIDAILTHELGHFKFKHLWKMMFLGTAMTFLGLWLVSALYSKWIIVLGFHDISQLAALPLLGLLISVFGFFIGPLQNAISRHQEKKADLFSVKVIGEKAPMEQALEKLAEQNLADRDPHPVVEFLFHSHPSIKHRIENLRISSLNDSHF